MNYRDNTQTHDVTDLEREMLAKHPGIFATMRPAPKEWEPHSFIPVAPEVVLADRRDRYRAAVCDALGQAGWEINSEDELDAALDTLRTTPAQSQVVEPVDGEL